MPTLVLTFMTQGFTSQAEDTEFLDVDVIVINVFLIYLLIKL